MNNRSHYRKCIVKKPFFKRKSHKKVKHTQTEWCVWPFSGLALIRVKNFTTFTGKHVLESRFNKVAGLKACNVIKERLQNRCFLVNIAKFLRGTIRRISANGCFWNNYKEAFIIFTSLQKSQLFKPFLQNVEKWLNKL